jgi:hypothetical protein
MRISAGNGEISFNEHTSYDWVDCDVAGDKYVVCFESPVLNMKLPIDALDIGQWAVGGLAFSVRFHESVHLFGETIGDLYVVSIEGQEKHGYVYSKDRGVIAVFMSNSGKFGIVFIEGRCGYGAPTGCYAD